MVFRTPLAPEESNSHSNSRYRAALFDILSTKVAISEPNFTGMSRILSIRLNGRGETTNLRFKGIQDIPSMDVQGF